LGGREKDGRRELKTSKRVKAEHRTILAGVEGTGPKISTVLAGEIATSSGQRKPKRKKKTGIEKSRKGVCRRDWEGDPN